MATTVITKSSIVMTGNSGIVQATSNPQTIFFISGPYQYANMTVNNATGSTGAFTVGGVPMSCPANTTITVNVPAYSAVINNSFSGLTFSWTTFGNS
jgi:hypothetical protein